MLAAAAHVAARACGDRLCHARRLWGWRAAASILRLPVTDEDEDEGEDEDEDAGGEVRGATVLSEFNRKLAAEAALAEMAAHWPGSCSAVEELEIEDAPVARLDKPARLALD